MPITQGQTTSFPIIVHPNGGQMSIPLHATVTATDPTGNPLSDPNPGNNTVDRTTDLNKFKIDGGGLSFGCAMGYASGAAGSTCAAGGLLLLAALLLASRRRRLAN
jgi:hypothetical protein